MPLNPEFIHLFASVNQTLLRRWDALLLLDLFLNLGDLWDSVSYVEVQETALEPPYSVYGEMYGTK